MAKCEYCYNVIRKTEYAVKSDNCIFCSNNCMNNFFNEMEEQQVYDFHEGDF